MRVAVVGHVEWVEFARVEQTPSSGEIVHAWDTWSQAGGGGAVAALQLKRLAGEVALYTGVGDDELGRRMLDELSEAGLKVHATRSGEQRRAFCHVDETGERTITVLGEKLRPRGDDGDLPWEDLVLVEASWRLGDRPLKLLAPNLRGDDVCTLQRRPQAGFRMVDGSTGSSRRPPLQACWRDFRAIADSMSTASVVGYRPEGARSHQLQEWQWTGNGHAAPALSDSIVSPRSVQHQRIVVGQTAGWEPLCARSPNSCGATAPELWRSTSSA